MSRSTIARAGALAAAAFLGLSGGSVAQTPAAVHSFVSGSGQTAGQEPAYFPANVLGLPDTAARRGIPSIDPRQILSLGNGGVIVLRFDDPIVDGAGPDFTVFENAFSYTIGPRERIYAEPAEVAVSRDGITFTSYPYDPETLEGLAGTAPTNGDRNPFDPRVSGGNSFDLGRIGVDSIRFIRLRDVVRIVLDDPSHRFWDPTLSGFDLDAVVAIPAGDRTSGAPSPLDDAHHLGVHPNPAREVASITASDRTTSIRLLDIHGRAIRTIEEIAGARTIPLDLGDLATGVYLVEAIERDGARRTTLLRVVR